MYWDNEHEKWLDWCQSHWEDPDDTVFGSREQFYGRGDEDDDWDEDEE